jgi:hypothetical protein
MLKFLPQANGRGSHFLVVLTWVGANIVRRIRLALEKRRLEESDSDRMMRRSIRNFSLWLVGGPIALGLVVWLQDVDLSILVLFVPIVYIGLLLLLGNLWSRPTTDARTAARQARRARLFTTIVFLGSVPRFFLYPAHRHLLLEINLVELVLGLAILFWPKEWWPIRPPWMPPEDPRAQDSPQG